MGSFLGKQLHLSLFGQSHAPAVGMTLDGLPPGQPVDLLALQQFLDRRRSRGSLSTARREEDVPQILCGLVDGVTCGAPLTGILENKDCRPQDYQGVRDLPRPSHADFTSHIRYQGWQDVRGGGHSSGRLTAPMCLAGGICLQILKGCGIQIAAHIHSIAHVEDRPFWAMGESQALIQQLQQSPLPVLESQAGEKMAQVILKAKAEGDSVGGVIECIGMGLPAGVGSPIFDGLEGRLASGLFGIPGVKGVEFGGGFAMTRERGSQANDPFGIKDGKIYTKRNQSGGIQGGISNGMPLILRVAVKPTPSIAQVQDSVDLSKGKEVQLQVKGRHDPCIVPRAVPVVESMVAVVLLDALLEGDWIQRKKKGEGTI